MTCKLTKFLLILFLSVISAAASLSLVVIGCLILDGTMLQGNKYKYLHPPLWGALMIAVGGLSLMVVSGASSVAMQESELVKDCYDKGPEGEAMLV